MFLREDSVGADFIEMFLSEIWGFPVCLRTFSEVPKETNNKEDKGRMAKLVFTQGEIANISAVAKEFEQLLKSQVVKLTPEIVGLVKERCMSSFPEVVQYLNDAEEAVNNNLDQSHSWKFALAGLNAAYGYDADLDSWDFKLVINCPEAKLSPEECGAIFSFLWGFLREKHFVPDKLIMREGLASLEGISTLENVNSSGMVHFVSFRSVDEILTDFKSEQTLGFITLGLWKDSKWTFIEYDNNCCIHLYGSSMKEFRDAYGDIKF